MQMPPQDQFAALPSPPHRFALTESEHNLIIEHCGRLFKWSELRLPLENDVVSLPAYFQQSRYARQLQAKLVESGYEYRFAYDIEGTLRRGLGTVQFKR